MSILEIREVRNIAAQGVTRPVYCVADDGATYVVKGAFAGHEALIHEWIASRLGQELGLPIPQCSLLRVPSEFFSYSSQTEELKILGPGCLFGSRWQRDMVELRLADVGLIDLRLRAEILAFDYWIGNGDRTLTQFGGNPNLLWSPSEARLAVIDHNLAFDFSDSTQAFKFHVFYEDRTAWSKSFRNEMEIHFSNVLQKLGAIIKDVPFDWLMLSEQDYEGRLVASLSRFKGDSDTFWDQV